MAETDDRNHRRHPAKLQVEIRSELQGVIHGTARDVAMAGLFVACSERLPVGTVCDVAVRNEDPEGPEEIRATCRVAHTQAEGIGLQITEIDLPDHEELRRLVDARDGVA